ncbi:unnamed protein product [Danaus chrysippus]|uniref:(African queen) hypothetical protein n=1 Tax=Danaus chrysippus TaxID=151541 RepID=A0A8J2QNL7_9NEOP|nr:unnamed protein product [Danaus chrysippus]
MFTGGRVFITSISTNYLQKAIVIAIRYSAVRRQFGPENSSVQEIAAGRGIEVHALSSAVKPVCGWGARDGIQAARDACGRHGYLTAAGICDLRNDNDANCTYDGENSLLLQQTSNWLLSVCPGGENNI